ncbi:MAG TPA: shikimate dehydrogenase [Candidatus Acidoferrales bacterium]|nr:shikimate dehydrogenase [Candidatus Acidoferrales bacterium]
MGRGSLFGKDRICAVAAAPTAREMWRQARRALKYTRTIELRMDWLKSDGERLFLISELKLSRLRGTFIATFRRRQAGGRYAGDISNQVVYLAFAIRAGCKWCDLEVESVAGWSLEGIHRMTSRARRILSGHSFAGTPASAKLGMLSRIVEKARKTAGMDAIKIAMQCETLAESVRVLDLARGKRNVIAVPMGEAATPARILALREGSALAYAPVETATAPGQVSLEEMKNLYRADKLDRHTRVYGVIGNPVGHSLSPVLQNVGFQAGRVNAVYLPFQVKDLPDFLGVIERLGIKGFSVTLPHKERMLRHLDECDPLAAAIGAVNTVVVRGAGKLYGYNTDYVGVLRALERRIPIAGSRVLIYGAGGAARAVAFALERGGASVAVCARRLEKAKKLARAVHGEVIPRPRLRREYFDATVNATPVGMHPNEDRSPLEARELNCRLVFDLIYRPRETKLLKLAARRGIETVSGVEMFLAQGIAQWEIWMGERAPEKAMRKAVLQALRKEEMGRAKR